MEYKDPEIRRIELAKKIVITTFLVAIVYLILYYQFGYKSIALPLVSPFVILPIVLYVLIYFNYFAAAKIVGLLMFNTFLFVASSSENTSSGVYLHFITCIAAAIALFRYEQRWISLCFSVISMALFIIVNQFKFNIVPFRNYPDELLKVFFTLHTVSVTFTSIYCILLIMGMNYDAEKHLSEKQLIIENQNEELKKTNEELDRFVYSASHDLRAPLTGISGLVNLMEVDKETPHEFIIEKIKAQIGTMESFISDIVNYSRNSRLNVSIEPVHLHELVAEAFKTLSHFNNAPNISLENKIDRNLVINTDLYRLRVVLSNLIANAIKYTDLTKSNPFVSVSFKHDGNKRVVLIEDNGIGIEKDHLPKIFEMFYRASFSSRGSGLGLYIVQESIKKLNYKIEVQSFLGVGTTFSIVLSD